MGGVTQGNRANAPPKYNSIPLQRDSALELPSAVLSGQSPTASVLPPPASSAASVASVQRQNEGAATASVCRSLHPAVFSGQVARCERDDECSVISKQCCACGVIPYDALRAINRDYGNPNCAPNVGCPACAAMPEKGVTAVCVNRRCRVQTPCEPEGIIATAPRDSRLGSCQQDNDCTIQPVDCCACGTLSASGVYAIRKDARKLIGCLGSKQCDDCVGNPSSSLKAMCVHGQCAAVRMK